MPRIIQNGFMFHHLAYRYTPVESVSGPASPQPPESLVDAMGET